MRLHDPTPSPLARILIDLDARVIPGAVSEIDWVPGLASERTLNVWEPSRLEILTNMSPLAARKLTSLGVGTISGQFHDTEILPAGNA